MIHKRSEEGVSGRAAFPKGKALTIQFLGGSCSTRPYLRGVEGLPISQLHEASECLLDHGAVLFTVAARDDLFILELVVHAGCVSPKPRACNFVNAD